MLTMNLSGGLAAFMRMKERTNANLNAAGRQVNDELSS